ncbi:hypothetical protein BJX64DRAFT_250835 [Aspergillus heterothallicus]
MNCGPRVHFNPNQCRGGWNEFLVKQTQSFSGVSSFVPRAFGQQGVECPGLSSHGLASCVLQGLKKPESQSPQLLLAISAGSGATRIVDRLLATIAVPDSRALRVAITMKFEESGSILIEKGAPVGLQASDCAFEHGLDEIVTKLRRFGAHLEQVTFNSSERECALADTEDGKNRKYDLSRTVEDLLNP